MEARADNDLWTVAATGVIAFVLADVAHEVVGHGVGFLLAGGRAGVLTTTRLIETQVLGDRGGLLFDLGGPAGNLACAGLAWWGQRLLRGEHARARLMLWQTMCFSLFWAFGYLLFCGVVARGDWYGLVARLPFPWIWRAVLFVSGFLLYRAAINLADREMRWLGGRKRRLGAITYWAGGAIACLGPALDPRGAMEMWNSGALSSLAGAVGLLRLAGGDAGERVARRSWAWMLAALVVGAWFVLQLGPGIRFRL
jgi:hypothetical protein